MITIYDEKYNITFWDIYKGEKTIRDVLDAAKKLYDMRSPTVYREDIDGMGSIHIQKWIDVRPECVDELVKRFGDRPYPKVPSRPKKGCPDDQYFGMYVSAINGKMYIPEGEMALLEKHFGECDFCMAALMNLYSAMMVDDDKYIKRLLADESDSEF